MNLMALLICMLVCGVEILPRRRGWSPFLAYSVLQVCDRLPSARERALHQSKKTGGDILPLKNLADGGFYSENCPPPLGYIRIEIR